jgi:hypothetical protein
MIDVYVWNPIGAAGGVFGRSVGHGAMLVLPDPARPERGRYISWWPLAVGGLEAASNVGVRPYPNTWSEDLRDMGRPPDRCWMLNRTGTDFDETAIMRAWDAEASRVPQWSAGNRANPEYRALDRNCCSTVMNLLFGPGGGARYRTYGPIPRTWWNPNDVNAWMEGAATRGLALGISPPPPPPGGVPAFGRSHLEGPEADRLTELGRRHATMAPPRPGR